MTTMWPWRSGASSSRASLSARSCRSLVIGFCGIGATAHSSPGPLPIFASLSSRSMAFSRFFWSPRPSPSLVGVSPSRASGRYCYLLALGDGLQLGEPLLDVGAEHVVHVHEHAEGFAYEIVVPIHRPRHERAGRRTREGERTGCRGFHRLHELELHAHLLARDALFDRHLSLADFLAAPRIRLTDARRGPFEGRLHVGIELLPRRTEKDQDTRELMEVVENTEHEIRWSSARELALDAIGGRPCGHHRDEKDQDTRDTDENVPEH